MPHRFVVIATPRCGSNWLCTLLNSHPQILCHHELFNEDGIRVSQPLREQGWTLGDRQMQQQQPLQLLELAWRENLGFSRVGFKININQSPAVFEAVLADPSIQKILIRRRNRVRTYLSEEIALRTGHWESYDSSGQPPPTGPIKLRPDGLFEHSQRNQTFYQHIETSLDDRAQTAFHIAYEDIPDADVRQQLLVFLGVDTDVPLLASTSKMNPGRLDDMISNFEALSAALKGTDFEDDLIQDTGHAG